MNSSIIRSILESVTVAIRPNELVVIEVQSVGTGAVRGTASVSFANSREASIFIEYVQRGEADMMLGDSEYQFSVYTTSNEQHEDVVLQAEDHRDSYTPASFVDEHENWIVISAAIVVIVLLMIFTVAVQKRRRRVAPYPKGSAGFSTGELNILGWGSRNVSDELPFSTITDRHRFDYQHSEEHEQLSPDVLGEHGAKRRRWSMILSSGDLNLPEPAADAFDVAVAELCHLSIDAEDEADLEADRWASASAFPPVTPHANGLHLLSGQDEESPGKQSLDSTLGSPPSPIHVPVTAGADSQRRRLSQTETTTTSSTPAHTVRRQLEDLFHAHAHCPHRSTTLLRQLRQLNSRELQC